MKFLKVILMVSVAYISLNASEINTEKPSAYEKYIKGSIGVRYTLPFNGDTYLNAEGTEADAVSTLDVDLFLLPEFYGGLYVGYKKTFSDTNEADDLSIEKRLGNYSIVYKKLESSYDIVPAFSNDIRFINKNSQVTMSQRKLAQKIPYDYDKYEIRNYRWVNHNGRNYGYIAFFMEDITKLVLGRDVNKKITKDYYIESNIKVYSLSLGIKERDYELEDGFAVSSVAFDLGMATIAYTDDYSYGDNGVGESNVITWGMNFEVAYKYSFTNSIGLIIAAYGGYTEIGDELSLSAKSMTSYGNVGLRSSLTF